MHGAQIFLNTCAHDLLSFYLKPQDLFHRIVFMHNIELYIKLQTGLGSNLFVTVMFHCTSGIHISTRSTAQALLEVLEALSIFASTQRKIV